MVAVKPPPGPASRSGEGGGGGGGTRPPRSTKGADPQPPKQWPTPRAMPVLSVSSISATFAATRPVSAATVDRRSRWRKIGRERGRRVGGRQGYSSVRHMQARMAVRHAAAPPAVRPPPAAASNSIRRGGMERSYERLRSERRHQGVGTACLGLATGCLILGAPRGYPALQPCWPRRLRLQPLFPVVTRSGGKEERGCDKAQREVQFTGELCRNSRTQIWSSQSRLNSMSTATSPRSQAGRHCRPLSLFHPDVGLCFLQQPCDAPSVSVRGAIGRRA